MIDIHYTSLLTLNSLSKVAGIPGLYLITRTVLENGATGPVSEGVTVISPKLGLDPCETPIILKSNGIWPSLLSTTCVSVTVS